MTQTLSSGILSYLFDDKIKVFCLSLFQSVSNSQKSLSRIIEISRYFVVLLLNISNSNTMAFNLPQLPYSYDALEPHFDAETMKIHHTKHHAAYTANLNAAIENTELANQSIEEILAKLDLENKALRNNAGGYYNHNLFWESLCPEGQLISLGSPPERHPVSHLSEAINSSFGSYEEFKAQFSKAAASVFGSGWAWLCSSKDGTLCICSTANQDNPLMPGVGCDCTPILGLDVWEHAYYLNYQNRRPDYIAAFFNIIDWDKIEKRRQSIIG